MSETSEAINKVYYERSKFLIIGLTGRTGSGCTTVANILNRAEFGKLDLTEPKAYDYKDSEEIKYSVLYKYAKSNNWKQFQKISMASVIASFIFEKGYDSFINYIKQLKDNVIIALSDGEYESIFIARTFWFFRKNT